MRVLLVNDYATATAGAEMITLHLKTALQARGHEVRVFSSSARLIAGESFANVTCFGTTTRLQTLSSAVNPSAVSRLGREIASFRPDVVQIQMFLWQLSPMILDALRHVPSVYYAMTYKAVCPTGSKLLPSGAHCQSRAGAVCLRSGCITAAGFAPLMLQRWLWRRKKSALAAVVAISDAVRAEFERDGIAVRSVIPPGIPVAQPGTPAAGNPTFTYAGRLSREKGVHVLLDAFRAVAARYPHARLVIAGNGPEEQRLRAAAAADQRLADAVRFSGQLTRQEVDQLIGEAYAHVVPSLWSEPFGLTAVEAMMRGTPVIVSDAGGLAEIVEHQRTGIRVPAGNADALADAMLLLLGDPCRAVQMGLAAHEAARARYSLDVFVRKFESLYQELGISEPQAIGLPHV